MNERVTGILKKIDGNVALLTRNAVRPWVWKTVIPATIEGHEIYIEYYLPANPCRALDSTGRIHPP